MAAYDGDRLNRNSTEDEKNNHSNHVEIDAARVRKRSTKKLMSSG
ncbi:hypothetical protein OL548_30090 [Lysinibacillus sp. MHQ-1]|nr:hypothetical protein OL548_30090 [Lysinibacillus sp. MHQ-1]